MFCGPLVEAEKASVVCERGFGGSQELVYCDEKDVLLSDF